MSRGPWIALALALSAGVAFLAFRVFGDPAQATSPDPGPGPTARAPAALPVVAEFHTIERQCLAVFNDALARQRANQIDELGLADTIERDVLPPWRTLRAHVDAFAPRDTNRALLAGLRQYLSDRQTAWEAYVAGLRAPSDAAARPHYDAYHRLDDQATRDARVVAPLLAGS